MTTGDYMRVKITGALVDALCEGVHNACKANVTDGPYADLSQEEKAPYRNMVEGVLLTLQGLGYRIHYNDHAEEFHLKERYKEMLFDARREAQKEVHLGDIVKSFKTKAKNSNPDEVIIAGE
jgi:hypothetical protein